MFEEDVLKKDASHSYREEGQNADTKLSDFAKTEPKTVFFDHSLVVPSHRSYNISNEKDHNQKYL